MLQKRAEAGKKIPPTLYSYGRSKTPSLPENYTLVVGRVTSALSRLQKDSWLVKSYGSELKYKSN